MNEEFSIVVERLCRECDMMVCPDCGGYHGVSFRLMGNGEVSVPRFHRGLTGLPCDGYIRLVNEKIRILKSRYHIDDRP